MDNFLGNHYLCFILKSINGRHTCSPICTQGVGLHHNNTTLLSSVCPLPTSTAAAADHMEQGLWVKYSSCDTVPRRNIGLSSVDIETSCFVQLHCCMMTFFPMLIFKIKCCFSLALKLALCDSLISVNLTYYLELLVSLGSFHIQNATQKSYI